MFIKKASQLPATLYISVHAPTVDEIVKKACEQIRFKQMKQSEAVRLWGKTQDGAKQAGWQHWSKRYLKIENRNVKTKWGIVGPVRWRRRQTWKHVRKRKKRYVLFDHMQELSWPSLIERTYVQKQSRHCCQLHCTCLCMRPWLTKLLKLRPLRCEQIRFK